MTSPRMGLVVGSAWKEIVMSVKKIRAYGPLFAPKYDRPWLRYIVDGGDGVVGDSGDVEKPQGDEAKQDSTDWKAESRKWEARAKENKNAAERLKELEDAQKSELEKAQESLAQAQRDAEAAKLEAARLRIANTHKIGEDYLDLLTGSTEEELTAQAEKIAKLITSTTEEAPQPSGVVPTIGQAPVPKNVPLGDQIAAAEAAGDFETAQALKAQMLSTK